MSLDPVRLESAILRNDVLAVRELLRDATEPDRRAGASQLRSLLRGPDLSALPISYPGPALAGPQDLPGLVAFVFDHVARDQHDGRDVAAERAREQVARDPQQARLPGRIARAGRGSGGRAHRRRPLRSLVPARIR